MIKSNDVLALLRFILRHSFLILPVTYLLQLVPPRPQSRVTFGGTQLRNCSLSDGSCTSGSSGSKRHHAVNTSKSLETSRQARYSSFSEAEDFQGACFAQGHSSKPAGDLGQDIKPKKAKVAREMRELPFVHSASNQCQSFVSLEQSLTKTDTSEYHFWSKISSPRYENSFVRLDSDDGIESPLRAGAGQLKSSSFSKTDNEPTRWSSTWQNSSDRAESSHGSRTYEDCFQSPGNIQQQKIVNSFGACSTASGQVVNKEHALASSLHTSGIPQKKDATVSSIATDQGCVIDDAAAARSIKWWSFVSGIKATDLSTPAGCLLSICFIFAA